MGRVELRVLGSVELVGDGGPVPTGGPKQRLLLAALSASRRRVVSVDALTEVLWGEEPPPTARSTLQTSVSKLRRLVADLPGVDITSRPPGYVLDVAPELVDADRFEADLSAARAALPGQPADARELLDRALGAWRGAAFAGFADLPWAVAEATRLEELRLQAVEDRNEARLALGDAGAVISELEGLTRAEPLRERVWSQLMLALCQAGRQAESLRVAAAFRRHLRDELGLDPSPTFAAVEQVVVGGAPTPLADDPPGHGPPVGLARAQPAPAAAAPLIGREASLDDAMEVIRRSRLVTVTGPGGVGKSTVAAELARRLAPSFRHGVRLVELAPIADAAAVVAAVAQSVDAERRSERSLSESIIEVLAPLELLLVVDNCEHVIDTVGELVAQLVRWCPSLTILATSREPIGMAGEVVRPLAPLAVPIDAAAPLAEIAATAAVEVFVARAAEAVPGFELDEGNARAVAELCIQLDGLPLALELAAARMSSMTPSQLAERLNERFALLGSGHGRARRHRTLLDVVQWSYGLLDPTERELLARVSAFAGGFDLDAAERTCAGGDLTRESVAPVLGGLVDKSLVVTSRVGAQLRYSQLETLRQFGAERLAETPDGPLVHRAHLRTFVDRAVTGGAALDTVDEGEWAARLDTDMDNLRAALMTAIALGDADAALTLVASVSEDGFRSIRYEVVDWAETVLGTDAAQDHPLGPTALAIVGYGSFVRGELARAVALAEQAVELRERLDVASCGLPERVLGNALFYQGHRDAGIGWMARMVDAARHKGSDGRIAHALYMRSVAQTSVGDPDAGAALAEEALVAAAASGSPTARAQATYATALAAAHVHPDEALALMEEAAALADSVGNRWMRSFARTEAMWLRAKRGESDLALAGYRDVVATWFRGGDWANQWLSLRHLAGILADLGRDGDAAMLSGAVEAAGAAAALPFAPADADDLIELSRRLAERLGNDALAEAKRRGARMRDDAAVALALGAIDSLLSGPAARVTS